MSLLQENIIGFASLICLLVCLLVPIIFKRDIQGKEEVYYLVAFYISAIIHFLTMVNPHSGEAILGGVARSIAIVNGALLPFFISAFVCKRNNEPSIFSILVTLVIANSIITLLIPNNIILNLSHAILCNIIGLIALLRNLANRADIGLSICFVMMLAILCYVLFNSPADIDPILFYDQSYLLLEAFLPAFICGSTVFIFLRYYIELNNDLSLLAHTDALTGLSNRRFAFQQIQKQKSFLIRKELPACIVMTDIDHFKQVNDQYGHIAGDEAIKAFAEIILQYTRKYDIACRYGGEEFLLFLPDTTVKCAHEITERIRVALENKILLSDSSRFSITASFGIATYCMNADIDDIEINIEKADKALYSAKINGRNKTVLYSHEE